MFPYASPSPFPPSFEGHPWAYAFGLFDDLVAASLALTMLLTYLFESRRHRQVQSILRSPIRMATISRWSPLSLYRTTVCSMLLFVVMRTAPDALWMLAWSEVNEPSIRFLLQLDLWMDGLALFPFFLSVTCWARGRQVIPQLLVTDWQHGVRGGPAWDIIWRNGRIVLVVLVIAIGVTIGKASA